MVQVVFYEKPGCINNTRQKQLLIASGHEVEARNLLTEAWTATQLQAFFVGLEVVDWFNRAAPRIKSGEVNPAGLQADAALALMLDDPLLIRRPLMKAAGGCMAGFEPDRVQAWIGLILPELTPDLQTCPKADKPHACGTYQA